MCFFFSRNAGLESINLHKLGVTYKYYIALRVVPWSSCSFETFEMTLSSPQGLRQRKFSDDRPVQDACVQPEKTRQREEVVWGKTPGGEGEC